MSTCYLPAGKHNLMARWFVTRTIWKGAARNWDELQVCHRPASTFRTTAEQPVGKHPQIVLTSCCSKSWATFHFFCFKNPTALWAWAASGQERTRTWCAVLWVAAETLDIFTTSCLRCCWRRVSASGQNETLCWHHRAARLFKMWKHTTEIQVSAVLHHEK